MRRRSCCDAPRHAFANLVLKYRFTTCISTACRDKFLRTARLCAAISEPALATHCGFTNEQNCPPKFYPFAPWALACASHLYAVRRRIRDAKIQRRTNEAIRARQKIQRLASVSSGADETSDGSEAILLILLSQALKKNLLRHGSTSFSA